MVNFCPDCEKILRKKRIDGKICLVCTACGYSVEVQANADSKSSKAAKIRLEKKIANNRTRIVNDDDMQMELMPKTNVACPKCDNKEAYYTEFQTRSADEPATTFYQCVACKHRWREY